MFETNEKLGGFPFVIGGLSVIPLLGIPFGIAALIWGITTNKIGGKKLALLGGAGIVVTLTLYGSLFYFGFAKRGGIYDELRTQLARNSLNTLVQAVEFYKVQHGSYPDCATSTQHLKQDHHLESPRARPEPLPLARGIRACAHGVRDSEPRDGAALVPLGR
jgi:hypothetical protein